MKIYVAKNKVRHGPFQLSELNAKVASGYFEATDFACFDGKNWVSMSDVPGVIIPTDHFQTGLNSVANPVSVGLETRFPKRKFSPEKRRNPTVRTLHFTGRGSEFFRIWITNLLLTICTLGLYSAWAKVHDQLLLRKHHFGRIVFFFRGQPHCHSQGKNHCLCRIRGLHFISDSGACRVPCHHARGFSTHPSFGRPFDAIPDAKYGVPRSEVQFYGQRGACLFLFFGGVILTYISMGILFPWWDCQKKQYLLGNLRYGNKRFESFPRAGVFYKCAGICILMGIGMTFLMILISVAGGLLAGDFGFVAGILFLYLSMGILWAYWHVSTTNHVMESTYLPGCFSGVECRPTTLSPFGW